MIQLDVTQSPSPLFFCKVKDSDCTSVNVRKSFLVHLMIDLKHGSGTVVGGFEQKKVQYEVRKHRGYIVYVNHVANLSR